MSEFNATKGTRLILHDAPRHFRLKSLHEIDIPTRNLAGFGRSKTGQNSPRGLNSPLKSSLDKSTRVGMRVSIDSQAIHIRSNS